MPKKAAPAKARTTTTKSSGWGLRLRRLLFRPLTLFVLAILVSAWFLQPQIDRWTRRLETRPEYRISLHEIRVTQPNQWAPIDLVEQVVRDNELPETASILDETLLPRVSESFAAHPWVARVVGVRVSRATGLDVELEYRRPVAMVETARGLYPVDVNGVLLPPADFSVSDAGRLPLVKNIATTPQGPAGTAWGDPVVLAAARLADVLAPEGDLFAYWDRYTLQAIIAPDRRTAAPDLEDLDFELLTRGGSRIVWGRVPGADQLEPPVPRKLARLDEYLATYGSFERPRGPSRIDIREYQVISLESLDGDLR